MDDRPLHGVTLGVADLRGDRSREFAVYLPAADGCIVRSGGNWAFLTPVLPLP